MNGEDAASMWVIYHNPVDYPGKWVVRVWRIGEGRVSPLPDPFVYDSLDEARRHIPSWAIRIEREKVDEPHVKEMWMWI
jgi:hypothetical protein